ncbi:dTDP-4-dehydrorhamnose reductase [Thermofilum sp.]|uniref:dTDP-4-dehydrorhamnose reductase n=1 Tax=Thermofilum sp. TaxID=1961369 RepID=UPI003167AA09
MKILVTGASGLVGHKVVEVALKKGHEVYSFYREHAVKMGVPIMIDITDGEKLLKTVSQIKPHAIIHTAAYTDVDGCEANRDLAWRVNADATKKIAIASTENGSHMVYVSTDYVFDGEKGLYLEEDQPNPVNYYGFTKLKGEEFVKEHAVEWCIARTSVIYGWSLTGKLNFATWLINNLRQGKEIRALIDQYVSPTLNTNLAQMLLEIAERNITGVLHTAGATRVSRYEYATKLAEALNLRKELIKPATMSDIPWKAKRPRDSSLNVSKALNMLNAKPLSLDQALREMKKTMGIDGEACSILKLR